MVTVRKRGGATSLSSADVPTVSLPSDPGLNVPPGPGDALGEGVRQLGEGLADFSIRKMRKDEGLARDKDKLEYGKLLTNSLTDLSELNDYSDPVIMQQGQKMRQEMERIIEGHQGTDRSKERLRFELDSKFTAYSDTLAQFNVAQSNRQQLDAANRRFSGFVKDIISEPDLALSDPLTTFRSYALEVDDAVEDLGYSGPAADSVAKMGKVQVANAIMTPLLAEGRVDEAKEFFRSEDLADVVQGEVLSSFSDRIVQTERAQTEAERKMTDLFSLAERLLPPNQRTEENIIAKANELKRIGGGKDTLVYQYGNSIIGIDRKDGTTVFTRQIESPEDMKNRLEMEAAAKNLAGGPGIHEIAAHVGLILPTQERVAALFDSNSSPPVGGTTSQTRPAAAGGQQPSATPALPSPASQRGGTGGGPAEMATAEQQPMAEEVLQGIATPVEGVVLPPSAKDTLLQTQVTEEILSKPLGPDVEASQDLQYASKWFMLADLAFRFGKNQEARFALEMFNTIMENSDAIRRRGEMMMRVDSTILKQLGLPLNTTMGELLQLSDKALTLPTPEEDREAARLGKTIPLELARETGAPPTYNWLQYDAFVEGRRMAGDEAAGRLKTSAEIAEEIASAKRIAGDKADAARELRFISEGTGLVMNVLGQVAKDPTILGGVGRLRKAGRNVITLLSDFGAQELVDAARQTAAGVELGAEGETPEDVKDKMDGLLGVDDVGGLFDNKALDDVDILSNAIGIILARVQTPTGRIPVELIKRSIDDVRLQPGVGSEVVQTRLDRALDRFRRRRFALRTQFKDLKDPTDAFDPMDMEAAFIEQRRRQEDIEGLDPRVREDFPGGLPSNIPHVRINTETRTLDPVEPVETDETGMPVRAPTAEQRQQAALNATSEEITTARQEAEERFPFLKQFEDIQIASAVARNKGGLGEFVEPDSPDNPMPGQWTITIGEESKNQPGGIADTIVADMVHAAAILSPEFQDLKQELIENFSEKELKLARRRYENDFKGKYSGSNFATFENFLRDYWTDGVVQELLLNGSELQGFIDANPDATTTLNRIETLFKTGEVPTAPASGTGTKRKTKPKPKAAPKTKEEQTLEKIEKGRALSEAEKKARRGGV